jgi:hypothetical protein
MTSPQIQAHPFELSAFTPANFFSALSNRFVSPGDIATKDRAVYLANYLIRLGARLIITEYQYTDTGYLDDYAAYYVKCFESYDRRCNRIHFFSAEITKELFLRIVEGKASQIEHKRFVNSYLGFVVARPLPDAIIGRTILKTYDADDGRRNYTCIREYNASLFGIDLKVQSLAFQEQDTVIAACATVALWCAFNKTRDLFNNSPAPTPAEITRAANRLVSPSRSMPSHGLNVQQMTNAIQHIGLEPEVIRVTENTPLISLLYAHLKWGLPVILGVEIEGVGRHAITLVGYSLRKERVRKHEVTEHTGVEISPPMVGLRIDRLFAHDDRIGPFVRLNIEEREHKGKCRIVLIPKWPTKSDGSRDLPGSTDANEAEISRVPAVIYPETVIVAVHHKIRVKFEDVEKLLIKFTEVWRLIHPPDKSIEWDVHLTTTNEYKALMKSDKALSSHTKTALLLRPQPKYFWRSTLRTEGKKVMELLADASDMSRSFPIYSAIWYNQEDKTLLHDYLGSEKFKDSTAHVLGTRFWSFMRDWTA